LQQHRTVEVRDVETETDFADLRAMAKRIGFRSFRIIPLTIERRVLGTMAVSRVSPGGFPEEDIRFVQHVAELVALVLENALMAEVLGKERSRLETLLNVSTALVSSLNVDKWFQESPPQYAGRCARASLIWRCTTRTLTLCAPMF
jgi:GAF domain-containing protein